MASLRQIQVHLDVSVSVATCERGNLCQCATEKKGSAIKRRNVHACLCVNVFIYYAAVGSPYPWKPDLTRLRIRFRYVKLVLTCQGVSVQKSVFSPFKALLF